MVLIKSISGIRGTIGGFPGESLSPLDIVKFTSAYASWVTGRSSKKQKVVVIGRDSRISGKMVSSLVISTLSGSGIDVIDLGQATTPTVELAVTNEKADGGIIITASHNPGNWNALKLLDEKGEFISDKYGKEIIDRANNSQFSYAEAGDLGSVTEVNTYLDYHIDMIMKLPLVKSSIIKDAGITVAIDSVNSVGGIAIPKLLKRLGVEKIIGINSDPTGIFSHNPEPLPESLVELSRAVTDSGADVGFIVDPDVDRLAICSEDGSVFNEEYTLVACADYVLASLGGSTVSNMSSSRALKDITEVYGGSWHCSAVGEVNVVKKMKDVNAIIGGEGNGGIIYPELHYGRDALVGIALFLSHLVTSGLKCSELRYKYPNYIISKNRIDLPAGADVANLLDRLSKEYSEYLSSREDGLLIDLPDGWVHIRSSNTEPIIRVYSEATDKITADNLSGEIIKFVKNSLLHK